MAASPPPHPAVGVCFPQGTDGRRSTTATGRAIFADAARAVDPDLAISIEHTREWRSGYVTAGRDLVHLAARGPKADAAIATAGLASALHRMRFARHDTDVPMDAALDMLRHPGFGSVLVEGRLDREAELSLPYRGRRLFGSDLRRQVDRWVGDGIAEPELAEAVHAVLDHPEWLDLRDLHLAVLGASAEMGPTRSLLRWGATVHAVDLPGAGIWRGLIAVARRTAGRLRVPLRLDERGRAPVTVGGLVHPDDDAAIAAVAGADLIADTPELLDWLDAIDQPFTLATYTYADGARHVLLNMAADAVAASLLGRRTDISLAALATPTDAFAVPLSCVAEAQRRWEARGIAGVLQAPLRLAGQFEPNYPTTETTDDGTGFGITDATIAQQGPNYLLAKRIQRWRATTARLAGATVSMNIAPATRTRSVVSNQALAAAYAGASRFGIEVFEPATSSALMAALLVHDLRQGPAARPIAVHGGLWRSPYSARSVLGIAALLGLLARR